MEFPVGEFVQCVTTHGADLPARLSPESLQEVAAFALEALDPTLPSGLDVIAQSARFFRMLLLSLLPSGSEDCLPFVFELLLLSPQLRLAPFGRFLLFLGFVEVFGDAPFARVHGGDDAVVQEALQEQHQDHEVDDLGSECEPINLHGKPSYC